MFETIKKTLGLLSGQERRTFGKLVVLLAFLAVLDVAGVSSLLPFLALVSDSGGDVNRNSLLDWLYNLCGASDRAAFVLGMQYMVAVALTVSLAARALATYLQLRFSLRLEYQIGERLLQGVLRRPYIWFVKNNPAEMERLILLEVNQIIGGAVMPIFAVFTNAAVVVCFLGVLLIANFQLALIIGSVLGIIYLVIYWFSNRRLAKIGPARLAENTRRFDVVRDASSAMREIKLNGIERAYLAEFKGPGRLYAEYQTQAGFLAQMPRYAIEFFAFFGLLLVLIYLGHKGEKFGAIIPTLSLYALSGYRLMPAFQQIYAGITSIKFIAATVADVYERQFEFQSDAIPLEPERDIEFHRKIQLTAVSFKYPESQYFSINTVSLSIARNTSVAFVGASGSGKSTLLDIISGLITPSEGMISVDENILAPKHARRWQKRIGYVSQTVHLIDGTLGDNIALGSSSDEIDWTHLYACAKKAAIHDFIINKLDAGYQTKVGPNGIGISGGQRQRIGIARALYKKPDILLLDEVTSALDTQAESLVLNTLEKLRGSITIIAVTHNMGLLGVFDEVYEMSNGKLVGSTKTPSCAESL